MFFLDKGLWPKYWIKSKVEKCIIYLFIYLHFVYEEAIAVMVQNDNYSVYYYKERYYTVETCQVCWTLITLPHNK